MSEQSWKPLFRTPTSTVTRVLRSPAFLHSRERSIEILENPLDLRALADMVESLEYTDAPLSAVADRVAAAVRFLHATANRLDSDHPVEPEPSDVDPDPGATAPQATPSAGAAARERLLVATLHYLITPDDLVPDFRAGGYIDDVLLLSWVFGAAVNELAPYLPDDPDFLDSDE